MMKRLVATVSSLALATSAFAAAPAIPPSPQFVNTALQIPGLNTVCLVGDSITIAGNAQVGQTFAASGGTAPYSFSVTGLPANVNQSTATPSISFSPGAGPVIGTTAVAITVNDSASGTATYNFNLTINQSLQFTWAPVSNTGTLTLAMSARVYSITDRGPGYWISALSGGALSAHYNLNFGHSGDTTTNVLSRMGPILAAAPQCGAYALMIGTNDLNNIANPSVATIEGLITQIYQQLLGTNRPVVLQTITPRALDQTSSANTAKQLYAINRWIKSLAGTSPNLRVVDNQAAYGDPFSFTGAPRTYLNDFTVSGGTPPYSWSATGLPANVTIATGTPTTFGVLSSSAVVASTQTVTITASDSGAVHTGSTQYVLNVNPQMPNPLSIGSNGTTSGTLPVTQIYDFSYDGLHPKGAGGYAAFAPLVAALQQAISTAGPPTTSALDTYTPTNNPHGNLLPNGMMTFQAGTGTLSSGSSTTAAGIAPDGWVLQTLDNSITGTMTATGSAAVDSLGNPAVKIVLSGTATAGFQTEAFIKYTTTTFGNYASGAALTASCRVEVAAGSSHITAPYIWLNYSAGGVADTIVGGAYLNSANWDAEPSNSAAYSVVVSTPVPALAAAGGFGGTLSLRVGVGVTNQPSGVIAGTLTISACSLSQ